MGNVAFTGQCQPSGCSSRSYDKYTYYASDLQGNTTSISDPTGTTLTYNYSAASEITGIGSSRSDATHWPYLLGDVKNGPFGPLSYQFGNGLSGVRSYDAPGRLARTSVCLSSVATDCAGGTQIYGNALVYKGQRLLQDCDTVLNSCINQSYDDFNRQTSHNSVAGSTLNVSWTYDRYGNRWSQSASQGGGTPSFSYSASTNQITGLPYDAAGNLLNDGAHAYTYDAEGNVSKVDGGSTATYEYDAFNHRIRTVVGGTPYEFVCHPNGQIGSVWNGVAGGGAIAQNAYWGPNLMEFDTAGAFHFVHYDWLGTERMTTGYHGAVETTYSSLPYGDSSQTGGTTSEPFHFAELDRDSESGLDHATYRSYSNAQGRWLSPDRYDASMDLANSQSFNRYAYVGGSPLQATDPSGLDGESPISIVSSLGGCVEAIYQGGYNPYSGQLYS